MAKKKAVKKEVTVEIGRRISRIKIVPSARLRTLEGKNDKGWQMMFIVNHKGANIRLDKRKQPFTEVRLITNGKKGTEIRI